MSVTFTGSGPPPSGVRCEKSLIRRVGRPQFITENLLSLKYCRNLHRNKGLFSVRLFITNIIVYYYDRDSII